MHSYCDKLLSNHFDDYFIPISSINSYSTRLSTSNNLFYLELTLPPKSVPLHLLTQKCGRQYQTILSLQQLLPLNGNLRNTSYMKKIFLYLVN